jgi:hypothetical protein
VNGSPLCTAGACGATCDDGYVPCQGGCCQRWSNERFDTLDSTRACFGVWGSSATDVYAACEVIVTGGTYPILAHTTGDGTWHEVSDNTGFDTGAWRDVWGTSANDVYLVGFKGKIYHSSDALNWLPQISGTQGDLYGMWGSGPNDIYAVGYYTPASPAAPVGVILHSAGDGNWVAQKSGTTHALYDIWGSGPNDIYAVGAQGTILHSSGDGVWTPQPSGVTIDLLSIWGSGAGDVYVTGHGGVVHSTGNASWTLQTTNAGAAVWGSSATDVYVVDHQAQIKHSIGDGTWTVLDTLNQLGNVDSLDGIWGADASAIFMTSLDGGFVRGR